MLISTQLDTLGDLIRVNKVRDAHMLFVIHSDCGIQESMITKGVASVRSPVCNLQQSQPEASHERFTQSVIEAFSKAYGIKEQVALESLWSLLELMLTVSCYSLVSLVQMWRNITPYRIFRMGLQSFPCVPQRCSELFRADRFASDMGMGLRPNAGVHLYNRPILQLGTCCKNLTLSYSKRNQLTDTRTKEVEIRAKHGIVLDCNMRLQDSGLGEDTVAEMHTLAKSLEGKRYSFVDTADVSEVSHQATRDVRDWLLDVALRA